ncbi:pseudouridine synthase pus4 [Friedmanniomyces endolithicus]|uniref:tRNA pseudouridine(55) synthase n=1 Tax=Friedmanniomyces endolithicus TaxID=329885 RepID=A0AAN6FJI6_9PEZI|nr:pseudouridine synthase pus4 [Friedmanniomyces endolithicus]KAK0283014.1 pseudouridine synthase pus4 [Friedmanniomyces endolithicus]KAK0318315.1 pseudouridine synthase pus4 [Friedmanniomyces endolithicus]KAK0927514.1 pseudouridine synthase pus4 [Friedmanniomyces endolithicus]KAK0986480.1 pseudouridine synthase pus4 [Friedmanniomyces endolithicus]
MASSPNSSSPILDGVFAIHKPTSITSSQVIRDVQAHLTPSALFQPWLRSEEDRKARESHNQQRKRSSWKTRQASKVKMGHGGTLDPLATGVLILGVGSGTKSLNRFLTCTKSYDTVVLFGAATDTYDTEGKVVARKPYAHITREKVEQALEKFRGEIMQRPPIFSALRVQGKRLYEYAREGKEVPVEIQERPVTVENLELAEWMEGGSHEWKWPVHDADKEVKGVVQKVLHFGGATGVASTAQEGGTTGKRKLEDDEDETVNGTVADSQAPPSPKRTKSSPEPVASGGLPENDVLTETTITAPESPEPPKSTTQPCPAPAVRIRMTVTSGFYVRSLAHDLGAAVDSLGIMASLVRTRQGDFELGRNVLEYSELAEGEGVWGPRVSAMLKDWQGKEAGRGEDGAREVASNRVEGEKRVAKPAVRARVRRNSSSDEG